MLYRLLGLAYIAFSLVCLFPVAGRSAIVINEIHYNPPDLGFDSGSFQEFIELYNSDTEVVDLSGYTFSQGLTYAFPAGTTLNAGSYLVLANRPTYRTWNGKPYTGYGPYTGYLDNDGERITLARPDGAVVDSVAYNELAPWPRTPDGYGSSLERISPLLPPNDYHSWRASINTGGTPGLPNSTLGIPPKPILQGYEISPAHPTSSDSVTVRVSLDAPDTIQSATLYWEKANSAGGSAPEQNLLLDGTGDLKYFKGRSAPSSGLQWTDVNFNDAGWLSGPGGVGYGSSSYEEEYIQTTLSDMRDNYSTVYVRKKFSVTDPAKLGRLFLILYVDDGFVCYINGREVARDLAPTNYTYQSVANANHESDEAHIIDLGDAASLLTSGENALAVVGLNVTLSGSSDFVILPFLLNQPQTSSVSTYAVMQNVEQTADVALFEAVIPPAPSQTLMRFNIGVSLQSGKEIKLPHSAEIRPFESYFVFDGEVESLLPTMWVFHPNATRLPEYNRSVSGLVVRMPTEPNPQVFDGALVRPSRNGHKLRFLKGEEFRGDRTLNLIPERPPQGTSSGITAPHREHMGFWFFEQMNVPVPHAEWFRIIHQPSIESAPYTQQLVFQQVNERFLIMNDMDPEGDLYKRNYVSPNWEKHTNKETTTASINQLTRDLQTRDLDRLHQNIEESLIVEEFLDYVVASVLLSNWDGFHNNHWMYQSPRDGKWVMIPWDLDKVFGYTDGSPMFYRMPPAYPLNGQATQASREPGPVTGQISRDPLFYDEYIRRLRYEMEHTFAETNLFQKFDAEQKMLLDDLALMEAQLNRTLSNRRQQIQQSTDTLKQFTQLRREYLDGVLPADVSAWELY